MHIYTYIHISPGTASDTTPENPQKIKPHFKLLVFFSPPEDKFQVLQIRSVDCCRAFQVLGKVQYQSPKGVLMCPMEIGPTSNELPKKSYTYMGVPPKIGGNPQNGWWK